ncbi:MAG: prepilin-type N-terminal cleavage/methylation domain-containing protein [Chloroflexi bacterium]|nr:prepilin-type N-terminal cleavage/methylation domain-containing protein [Chloroflexota bacterium]
MKAIRKFFSGKKSERGFTLVEILIVLAVLAVLGAVVVPQVTGFLGRGKERAYDGDRRILQAAVDAWRTDVRSRVGNPWPTIGGTVGAAATATYIDIGALATGNYLKGADVVASADKTKNTTATQTVSGSYGWYLDTGGVVKSDPVFAADTYP